MSIKFFDDVEKSYPNSGDIIKDLNLKVIARSMAGEAYGDVPDIMEIMTKPLLSEEAIEKRLQVVMDCCNHYKLIVELRKILVDMLNTLNKHMKAIQDCRGKHLTEQTMIGTNLEAVRTLVQGLAALDGLLLTNRDVFSSTALSRFYEEFYTETSHERITEQKYLIDNLDSFKNKGEILLRARMGEGFHMKNVEILDVKEKSHKVQAGLFSGKRNDVISDEETYESSVEFTNVILLDILERCFPYLQRWQELLLDMKKQAVFLAGCARLYQRSEELNQVLSAPGREDGEISMLYELSLALQTHSFPVTNSLSVSPYQAIVVTGANQGGKSTFLRSMGIAQVMCQAGMFVPAKKYPLRAYQNIFTHFTRREDAAMNMGKFEEELKRMKEILERAGKDSLLLLNESFATTTEVTAYQIAMDLMHACLEEKVTLWMVTHITKFARELFEEGRNDVLFLSAGREAEKEPKYKMIEKEPGNTSYGLELYEQIIGTAKEREDVGL